MMTPQQAALLRLLQRHPDGLSLVAIITTTAGTHYSCSRDLRALQAEGLAGLSDLRGGSVLWAAAGDLLILKAKRVAEKEAAAIASRERAARRELTVREREEEEAACEAFATKPVPRILSQQEWIGQATSCGPSSVFSFGSALA